MTLLAQISQSVNSRPLSVQNVSSSSQQEDIMLPLTPNHLLLGRSTAEVPSSISFSSDNRFSTRLAYVQSVLKEWWQRWIRDVLPTLVPCPKWKDIRTNVKPNDIVMMKYPGNVINDYRLARVIRVYPDKKGLVRSVDIEVQTSRL